MRGKYRLVVVVLLFLVAAIAYMDRAAISVAAPVVSKDLHLSAGQMGIIFSAFYLTYSLFSLVGGYAVDRFGAKRTYSVAMVWWSVFCGATALVTGFLPLLLFRIAFGAGEGPMTTATNKAVTRWFPRQEAGKVMGTTLIAGNMAGAAIAGPVVGALMIAFGWRAAFVGVMLIGFVWLVAWSLFFKDDPAQSHRVGAAERSFIEANRETENASSEAKPFARYLRNPTVIGAAIAYFSAIYVTYFFLSWMPTYLVNVRHMDIASMGAMTVIPWIAGAVGGISSGAIGDAILARTGKRIFCRKIVVVVNLLLATCGLVIAMEMQSTIGAVIVMGLTNLCLSMVPGSCWMLVQESVPFDRLGSVGGVVNFFANLSGIIGPSLTGFVIEYGGGYDSSFILAAAVATTGALVTQFCVRQPQLRQVPAQARTV